MYSCSTKPLKIDILKLFLLEIYVMTSTELREKVVSKVHITEDKDILEFVLEFLNQSEEVLKPYVFTDEQKKRLDISLQQSKDGNVLSEEEEAKLTAEWLGK